LDCFNLWDGTNCMFRNVGKTTILRRVKSQRSTDLKYKLLTTLRCLLHLVPEIESAPSFP
jgi:hypothetical protein